MQTDKQHHIHENIDRRETNKSPGTEEDETLQSGIQGLFLLKSRPADAGLALPRGFLTSCTAVVAPNNISRRLGPAVVCMAGWNGLDYFRSESLLVKYHSPTCCWFYRLAHQHQLKQAAVLPLQDTVISFFTLDRRRPSRWMWAK